MGFFARLGESMDSGLSSTKRSLDRFLRATLEAARPVAGPIGDVILRVNESVTRGAGEALAEAGQALTGQADKNAALLKRLETATATKDHPAGVTPGGEAVKPMLTPPKDPATPALLVTRR